MDVVALIAGLRPLLGEARERRIPLTMLLRRGTDPAVTTGVLSSAADVAGGLVAGVGLAGRDLTGSSAIDAAASAVTGVILLATSVVLLHTNRELLTGRGVAIARVTQLRHLIGDEPGVIAMPDLFAIVVGSSSVIVDADVIFNDNLTVPQVEAIIVGAANALRTFWPAVASTSIRSPNTGLVVSPHTVAVSTVLPVCQYPNRPPLADEPFEVRHPGNQGVAGRASGKLPSRCARSWSRTVWRVPASANCTTRPPLVDVGAAYRRQ